MYYAQDEEKEFISVDRKDSHAVKKNAVFTVIGELVTENHVLIINSPYAIKKIQSEGSNAYLFNIPTAPENLLFQEQGFVYKERHLRVDQYYSLETTVKGLNGFSAAHYTETYIHSDTAQKITIHLYFANTQQYVQIRKTDGSQSEYIDADHVMMQLLRLNGYPALDFYNELIKEKNKRHLEALEKADQSEEKLRGLSSELNTKDSIQLYIDALDEFCGLIKKVNLYNELQEDSRGRMQYKSREFLLQRMASIESAELSEQSASDDHDDDEPSKADQGEKLKVKKKTPASKKQNAQQVFASKLDRLSQLLRTYIGKMDTASLDKAQKIATDIQMTILVYPSTLNDELTTRVKQVEQQIRELPNIATISIKIALRGDLEGVRCLLPHLRFRDQFDMVNKLLQELQLTELDDESEKAKAFRSICELLYKKSPYYAMILKVCTSIFKLDLEEKIGVSVLCLLGSLGKKYTFQMLLRHGADPNGLGFMHENVFFCELKAALMIFEDPFYARCLLENGAIVDAPKSKYFCVNPGGRQTINLSSMQFSRSKESELKNTEIVNSFDLMIACRFKRFELIMPLLERSCWQSQIIALAEACNLSDFITRQISYSKKPGLFVCATFEEANKLTMSLLAEDKDPIEVAFIIFTKSRSIERYMIFPRKNGHIAKQLVFPQTLLDSNSPVSNEDAYDYNTHRYIRTHVF